MTDLERELREGLRAGVERIDRRPLATRPLISRARRRRLGTALGSLSIVLVLVFGGAAVGRNVFDDNALPPAQERQQTEARGSLAVVGYDTQGLVLLEVGSSDPQVVGTPFARPVDSPCEQGCRVTSHAWSPDGERIAFIYGMPGVGLPSNLSLHVAERGDPKARLLVRCPSGDCQTDIISWRSGLSWSPDGSKIVITNGNGIFTVDTADGEMRKIVDCDRCEALDLAWSPDGSLIAYTSEIRDARLGVYVVRPDGSGNERVASVSGASEPDWSPDGTQLVFAAPHGLYIAAADGSGERQLAALEVGRRSATPSWSPDGSRIVYFKTARKYGGRLGEVWSIGSDGSDDRLLYRSGCCLGAGGHPRWSPDGNHVAFSLTLIPASDIGGNGVFVMDSDGGDLTRVSRFGMNPEWRP